MKRAIRIMERITFVVIIFLFIVGGMAYLFFEYVATNFQYEKIVIGKDCIYLKNRVYTNDNPKLFISTSKSRKINSFTDYLYGYSECFFYQIKNDSIFIFSREIANQPPKFKSRIHVIQDSLSNSEFMNLYENHKTLGYEQFPSR